MKRKLFIFIGVFCLFQLKTISSFSQDQSYLKISMGADLLGVQSNDRNFGFIPFSKINSFPSFRIDTKPVIYNSESIEYYFNVGAGFTKKGFKYSFKPDSVYYFKKSEMQIYIGIGFTLNEFRIYKNNLPISLTINGFSSSGTILREYINMKLINSDIFANESFMYGMSARLDLTLLPGKKRDLFLFYNVDYILKEYLMKQSNSKYQFVTHSIGLAFRFINGYYEPYYLGK